MQTFNFSRMIHFLTFEFRARRSEILLPLILPATVYSALSVLQILYGTPIEGWPSTAFAGSSLLALYVAANIHRKDLDPGTASLYLLLPVSHCERFTARWLLTCFFPFTAQLALLTLLAYIFGSISFAQGTSMALQPLPTQDLFTRSLPAFIVAHSIFFAGGIFFRKHPMIKTTFSVLAMVTLLFAVKITIGIAGVMQKPGFDFDLNLGAIREGLPAAQWANIFAWLLVLPLGLYSAAYQRNRENELRA
jgi:hypothetical protein